MNEQIDNNTAEGAEQPAIVVPDGLTGAEAEQFIQGELFRREIERKQAAGEPLTADEEASLGVAAAKAAEAEQAAQESAGELPDDEPQGDSTPGVETTQSGDGTPAPDPEDPTQAPAPDSDTPQGDTPPTE